MHVVTHAIVFVFAWLFRQQFHAAFFAGLASLGFIPISMLLAPDLYDLMDVVALAQPQHNCGVFLCISLRTVAAASISAFTLAQFERTLCP